MGGLIDVVVCSANAHKVAELHPLFPDWSLELLDASPLPPEDGETYVDNARIKARFGLAATSQWVIADDSGIEVAALDGAPGVQTARWAEGRHVEKLLAALEGRDNRAARYVCELVLLDPDGREHRGTGVLRGWIALATAGSEGFGFDPVFIPEGETQTVAELGDTWKETHSHRALAAQDLLRNVTGSGAPS
ncbi:MAG TPA: non-canonical purine NTP pyrophosphatase [Gaiellaceae bacterium]|nr:non-canonical purine NTP pyrophosphatase [Gaiellaceae bacterium]